MFVAHTRNTHGKIENYFTLSFTSPTDPKWGGAIAYYWPDGGAYAIALTGVIGAVEDEAPKQYQQEVWFAAPKAIETGKIYLVSVDYLGRQNTIAPGATPSFDIQIGVSTGTLDLSAAMPDSLSSDLEIALGKVAIKQLDLGKALGSSYEGAEFKIQGGKLTVNGVDLTKAIAGKLSAELGVSGGVFGINFLSAAKITAGTLGAGVVYAGNITAGQIVSGNISASVGYLGTITAGQITAGTFGAGVVYAGSIDAAQITAGTMTVSSDTLGLIVKRQTSNHDTRIYPGYIDGRYQGITVNWYVSTSSLGGYMAVKNQYGNEIAALRADGSSPDTENGLRVNGLRVVGPRLGGITGPSGGSVIDTQARAVIDLILNRLQTHGLIS